jgi:hypothetical protein
MAGYSTTFTRASTQYLTDTSPSGLVTGNGSRTVFGWVKFTTVPANQNYFLCDYTNGGTRGFAPFVTQSGGGSVKFALSDYVSSNPTDITVSADVWYFWAVTHDGTNTRLYWNGSLINTTARTLAMATAPTVMRVATAANNTTDLTNGKIFGVGWTSDAKTQGELDAIQLLSSSQINGTNISNLITALCVTNDFNDVTGTNNMTAVNSPTQTTDVPVADPTTNTTNFFYMM